jgi:hypothetical protein
MTIPDKIRIAGKDYAVTYTDKLNNGVNICLGHIDYDKATIEIEPNCQERQTMNQTLLHEILHGICNHYKLDINDNEDTIDKLANGFYMVIADNPEMFEADTQDKRQVKTQVYWYGIPVDKGDEHLFTDNKLEVLRRDENVVKYYSQAVNKFGEEFVQKYMIIMPQKSAEVHNDERRTAAT